MKHIRLGSSDWMVPEIAVGCMRIDKMSVPEVAAFLSFCVERGLNFFDHADIYGGGNCERLFGAAVREAGLSRDQLFVQSKCGIVPGVMYDFSKQHILAAVDGILQRLDTDYLDVLVLHRPDALVEPEEVAEAFDRLYDSGKVRRFGVSNHRPSQIALLKRFVRQPILVDQLQFSIPFSGMVASGLEANMETAGSVDHDGDVLNYCRLEDITIQAWSPFQYGCFAGPFIGNTEQYPKLNALLEESAGDYGVTPTAMAAAWILRHPAHVQMIAGSTSTKRLEEILQGSEITMPRELWYKLYLSAGHRLP